MGIAPLREKLALKERKDSIHCLKKDSPDFSGTDVQVTGGRSFEELHEQVDVLEQRALGELETALEAISGKQETLEEPSQGKAGSPSFEKRLWRDLSAFPDLFLICVGLDRRTIFVSDATLKSLGCREEEVAGVDIVGMLFPEPEREKAESVFSRVLEADHPLAFETRVRTNHQGALSVGWQMRLIRSPEEGQTYFFGIGMRKATPDGRFQTDPGPHDTRAPIGAIERNGPGHGGVTSTKRRLKNGFHSRWAYVVVYLLTSTIVCALGAISGSKAVYYNGWLVFLTLTHELHRQDLPGHHFMFGQELFGDYALLVGGVVFFLLPALFAVALVNAARSFGKD
jgi:PAS domain S-box-containing protein